MDMVEDYLGSVKRGEEGVQHLKRCVDRAMKTEMHQEFSTQDACLILKKLACVSFLGGGTFGAVFELSNGSVAKIIPRRIEIAKEVQSALSEFLFHQKFARYGLARAPKAYQSYQLRNWDLEFGIILMPKIEATLETVLRSRVPLEAPEAVRIGGSLARLIMAARLKGLVHNDLKCNNLSFSMLGLILFIDFGKSFDKSFLRKKTPPCENVSKILDLASAIDGWRLQVSIRKNFKTIERRGQEEALLPLLVSPTQALVREFLKKQEIAVPESDVDCDWWTDDSVLQQLKRELSRCFNKKRRKKSDYNY